MATGHGHHVAVTVEMQRFKRLLKRPDNYSVGARKTLAVRKRCPVVNYGDMEAEHRTERSQRHRYMARPRDYQPLRASHRIDKDSRRARWLDACDRAHGS